MFLESLIVLKGYMRWRIGSLTQFSLDLASQIILYGK